MYWKEAIRSWRRLTPEQRFRRHLAAIPRHVSLSMAMEGEPVAEDVIRKQLARLMSSSGRPEKIADGQATGDGRRDDFQRTLPNPVVRNSWQT